MINRYVLGLLLISASAYAEDKPVIYKCIDNTGNIVFDRGQCRPGTTGQPSDLWVKQRWVQDALRQMNRHDPKQPYDNQTLLDNPDWFYPNWEQLERDAAQYGITIDRIADCVNRHLYTQDLRPGIAAPNCIGFLADQKKR